ncbi:sensor histidine kinase [Nitrosococcus watsonii]|uniref:histidine kinase n=1 Tax=Nitrosococcus watsoni (strain C-113) TaxID=105559 RepID=D8K731_NITWC|nr:sensor histidine kinase [Nitrosococcus watsonii]ADJ28708.1 histidine kinase [Nitrosococcus watsonii C-113]
MDPLLSELSSYLSNHQQTIFKRWMEACKEDDALGAAAKLTYTEFRNNIPAALEGLCRILKHGNRRVSSETVRCEVAKHGHHRWKQGFSLKELIRDWGHLNQVLITTIETFFQIHHPHATVHRIKALERMGDFMIEAASHSVQRFDNLRQAEAAALTQDLEFARAQFEQLTQARGKLLREAAHDIRGGLSAIEGASAILNITKNPHESFTHILEILNAGINSVKEMLDSLLELSRLESGADEVELLSVNIADVLQQLAAEYRAVALKKDLRLSTDGPTEMWVRTDPEKARRIAQNLLINALKHTSSGEVHMCWRLESKRWLMGVSDTGPGMQAVLGSPVAQELNHPDSALGVSADHASSSINPNHSHTGEGIGLTIVKRLCDLLDAGISLESEVGQGTKFTVEFPRHY